MSADLTSLYTDVARFGAPIFFPLPTAPIFYNFDMGLAAEETFPLEDFQRLSREVVARDGGGALQYGDTSGGYAEMVYGYGPLRGASPSESRGAMASTSAPTACCSPRDRCRPSPWPSTASSTPAMR